MRFVSSFMYVVVVIGSTRLPVAAQEDLQPLLEREIIGSVLPLAEVQIEPVGLHAVYDQYHGI